ncbi:odorant-binding protein 99b [Glossina fuscipes fuscipes]
MKTIIVIVVLVGTLATVWGHHHHEHDDDDYVVKTREDLLKFRDECSTKLNVPADLLEKYKKWQYPDDELTKCYMKCMFKNFGFFDENHGFDVHKIHKQLVGAHGAIDHSDETHEKIAKCANKKPEDTDPCAWAYRGGVCFINSNLQLVKSSVN